MNAETLKLTIYTPPLHKDANICTHYISTQI